MLKSVVSIKFWLHKDGTQSPD